MDFLVNFQYDAAFRIINYKNLELTKRDLI